jgi:DmsE family decaheme c-type cytochrome
VTGRRGRIAAALALTLATAANGRAADKTDAPPAYAGSEQCLGCHPDTRDGIMGTLMGRIFFRSPRDERERRGCEACHGPGAGHAEAPGGPADGFLTFRADRGESVDARNGACLQCHRKGSHLGWEGSAHEGRGLSCSHCHRVMHPSSQRAQLAAAESRDPLRFRRASTEVCLNCHPIERAQLMRSSHHPLREGKLTCTDCHDPHGGGGSDRGLLVAATVNDTCYRCHAETRGPFLWEHPPAREDCLTCHEPHGSVHDKLLKAKMPRLCQTCHAETRHVSTPFDAASRFTFNRSCTNCHPQVHGSNHPSGVRFQR